MTGVATGRSRPAVVHVPAGRRGSYFDEVAEVAELMCRPVLAGHEPAVDALAAYGRAGKWLSLEGGVEMPRQNGKTGGVLLPIVVTVATTFEPDLMLWTAHRTDAALKPFFELKELAEASDELGRRIQRICTDDADEHVEFTNGTVLEFGPRSGRSGRAKSARDVIVDEALYFTPEQAGALLPTLATRSMFGNPRVWYGSSAAKAESRYLRSLRKRALAGDQTVSWVGWWARGSWSDPGCEFEGCSHEYGVPGCALDDEARWVESNPMVGVLTSMDFLRTMRRTLPPAEFGREFLGWQEDDPSEVAIDLSKWSGLADEDARPEPLPVVLAIDASPGLRSGAMVAAGRTAGGQLFAEVAGRRPGVGWMPDVLVTKAARVGPFRVRYLGGKAPIAAAVAGWDADVLAGLAEAGVELEEVSVTDYAAACTALESDVDSGGIVHLGDPILGTALGGASQKAAEDGSWTFARRSSTTDISPAVALALATQGIRSAPVLQQFFGAWR